jgi:hypothetical protein
MQKTAGLKREAPAPEKAALPPIIREGEKARPARKPNPCEEMKTAVEGAVTGEDYLFRRRRRLQEKKRAHLEALWGEPVAAVIYHAHTCGAANGYKGSPDGVFLLGAGDERKPWLHPFLDKLGIDAVFLSDHDAHEPGQLARLGEAVDALHAAGSKTTFFTGTEISSADGHIIVLERGKKLSQAPPPGTGAVEIAEWAFDNGFDVLVAHPNPSKANPKRVVAAAFGFDIGVEREVVDEILSRAGKRGRFAYVACSNGTTLNDYRCDLLAPGDSDPALYSRRAAWIAEADGHIACEYPSNVTYFRRSRVLGEDGRVSALKVSDAVALQKEADFRAREAGGKVTERDRLFVTYASEKDFSLRDKLMFAKYFVSEYSRLAIIWMAEIVGGRRPSYAEPREPEKELARVMKYEKGE